MKTTTYYDASTNKWKKIVIDDGNPNTISTSEITASDMKDLRKETDLNLYNGDNLSEVISKIYARVRNEEENGDIIGDEIGDYKSEPLFVSDNYSMSSDDHGKLVVCQNLQSNINLSLPADKKAGWVLTIVNRSGTQKESVNVIGKNKDASPNIIRYNAAGIATSSITLARNQKVTLISDGEFWYEISGSFAISSDIATNAVNDADGNNIIDTYLKQQEAADTYLRQDSTDYIKSISYDDHEISIGYANEEKDYTINTIKKADKLSTPRNINGVSFDGSSDITITEMPNGAAVTGTLSVSGDNAAADINGDINISKSGAKINFAEDSYIDANNYTGTSERAKKDESGNVIADTYLNRTTGGSITGSIDTTEDITAGRDLSVIGTTTLGDITKAKAVSATYAETPIAKVTDHIDITNEEDSNAGVNITASGVITTRNSSNNTVGTIFGDHFSGISDKATMDSEGNNIVDTYVKKEDYNEAVSDLRESKVNKSGDEMTGELTMSSGAKIHFVGNGEEPTEAFIDSERYTGTSDYAEKDSGNNVISETYARKDGTTFSGDVTFAETSTVTVNGALNTKNIISSGDITASKVNATSSAVETLTVNDSANVSNKLTSGSINVVGNATIGTTMDISGKLTVTNDIQAQNINADAAVTANTITASNDIQSLNGKVIANNGIESTGLVKAGSIETDSITVNNSVTADSVNTKNASISTADIHSLSVDENGTFTGSLSTNGIVNTGNITTDIVTVNTSMSSNGPALFNNSITAESAIVNRDISVNGTASISYGQIADLVVTGNTTVKDITAGEITADGMSSTGNISSSASITGDSIEALNGITGKAITINGDGVVTGRLNVNELDADTMIIHHEQLGDLNAEKVITDTLEVVKGAVTISSSSDSDNTITCSNSAITFNTNAGSSVINAETYDGKAAKATADKDGNEITSTYATKEELSDTESTINENITSKYEELDNNKVNNTGDTITGELSLEAALKLIKKGTDPEESSSVYQGDNGLVVSTDSVTIGKENTVIITGNGLTFNNSEIPTLTATEYAGNSKSADKVNNSISFTVKGEDTANKEVSFDGSSPVSIELCTNALTDADKVVLTDDNIVIDAGNASTVY